METVVFPNHNVKPMNGSKLMPFNNRAKPQHMKNLVSSLLVILTLTAFAQKQAEVNLELHDGNVIKGTANFNDIDLSTPYGKLLIPVGKVSNIKIGYGKDKSGSDKAMGYIKLINGSNNDEVRKNAYGDLVKMGLKALSALEDWYADPKNITESEYSGEYTVDNAYEEIKTNHNINENSTAEDVITIDNNYTMGGTYNFTKLDVKTEYGTLNIPKEKIKSIDIFVSSGTGGEQLFKLMANKNISGNQNGGWYKTGITLKQGQKFSMSATGEVTLASLSNAVYKPDGSTKAAGSSDYTGGDYEGSNSSYATYGMLVYKIGENSYDNLKAGAKFNGTAKTSGMLYISIYETVFNANNKGSYNVKINVNK